MNIDRSIRVVREHIERWLTGNVEVKKDPESKMVIFTWSKNAKTIYAEHFQQAFSYTELEQAVNPDILGKYFVEAYKRSKEEKIEKSIEPIQPPSAESIEPQIEEPVQPQSVENDQDARPTLAIQGDDASPKE